MRNDKKIHIYRGKKQEIREYRENNRDKRIEKRLEALEMRAEGKGIRKSARKQVFIRSI